MLKSPMRIRHFRRQALVLAALGMGLAPALHAAGGAEIGVVVMHGKGGRPGKFVDTLANTLERAGFQVANLEMPWSGRRHYDVPLQTAVDEISQALDAMRAKGVRKVFVAGHSQGGIFALLYSGQHAVDGVLPIAPGGNADAQVISNALAGHVARARQLIADGRGNEMTDFADHEGSRGSFSITTTPAIYLEWFDPNGRHTSRVFRQVKPGTPVLYVAPSGDYPGLAKMKDRNFNTLPLHPSTRLYAPDSDHLNAPAAAAEEAVKWIQAIAQP